MLVSVIVKNLLYCREVACDDGNDLFDSFQRAATYADRILKGATPKELPVQAPVKFELVINLKTAKALGLEVLPDRARNVSLFRWRLLQSPCHLAARKRP